MVLGLKAINRFIRSNLEVTMNWLASKERFGSGEFTATPLPAKQIDEYKVIHATLLMEALKPSMLMAACILCLCLVFGVEFGPSLGAFNLAVVVAGSSLYFASKLAYEQQLHRLVRFGALPLLTSLRPLCSGRCSTTLSLGFSLEESLDTVLSVVQSFPFIKICSLDICEGKIVVASKTGKTNFFEKTEINFSEIDANQTRIEISGTGVTPLIIRAQLEATDKKLQPHNLKLHPNLLRMQNRTKSILRISMAIYVVLVGFWAFASKTDNEARQHIQSAETLLWKHDARAALSELDTANKLASSIETKVDIKAQRALAYVDLCEDKLASTYVDGRSPSSEAVNLTDRGLSAIDEIARLPVKSGNDDSIFESKAKLLAWKRDIKGAKALVENEALPDELNLYIDAVNNLQLGKTEVALAYLSEFERAYGGYTLTSMRSRMLESMARKNPEYAALSAAAKPDVDDLSSLPSSGDNNTWSSIAYFTFILLLYTALRYQLKECAPIKAEFGDEQKEHVELAAPPDSKVSGLAAQGDKGYIIKLNRAGVLPQQQEC